MIVSIAFPIAPVRVQALSDAAEADAPRRQLIYNSKNVLGVAPEPVKLPDREDITFAEVVEAGIELRALGRRTADAVVGEDTSGPRIFQRVELKLGFWSIVETLAYPMTAITPPCLTIPPRPGFCY